MLCSCSLPVANIQTVSTRISRAFTYEARSKSISKAEISQALKHKISESEETSGDFFFLNIGLVLTNASIFNTQLDL